MFIMSLHYHYITLHRYICDDIRAGSPWGRATDGILISDSDLIWISHSSLLTHSLSGTSQPADQGTIEEIPQPPVNPKHEQFKEKPPACFHLQTQEGQTGVWKWAGLQERESRTRG